MASNDLKNWAVFQHPIPDPDETWLSNGKPSAPTQVFTGTEDECRRYVERSEYDHGFNYGGPFDPPSPRYEVMRISPDY